MLTKYCKLLEKPIVVFFNKADCLYGDTIISFLRQLRSGYVNRVLAPFVHSIALVGMRNIRDYKALIRSKRETLGSANPFNIVAKTMTLNNFKKEKALTQGIEQTKQYMDTLGCTQGWLVIFDWRPENVSDTSKSK